MSLPVRAHDHAHDRVQTTSADSLIGAIRHEVAELLGLAEADIRDDELFARLGLDSMRASRLMASLSETVGRPLSPALVWAHSSIAALAAHLHGGHDEHDEAAKPAGRMDRVATSPRTGPAEPIAIIGVACRFPGADRPADFWRLLCDGDDMVRESPSRWDAGRWKGLGSMASRMPDRAGFLESVDAFDPLFFGISPREAIEMDPQQRLFLEVAWEALEDAGAAGEALFGSQTGVFAGAIWHDYADLRHGRHGPHTATGQALNMIANRLSYVLGLRGPSLAVDSACSSSLLAVHLACQSIWAGESAMAVAGGVNLLLSPHTMVALTEFGGLAPDGRCKAFDATADGFGRGEGCGVVVLKPLSMALADGDDIWCTIRGSATNNDGLSNGLTAPNPIAQEEVLRAAYRRSGVDPGEVHFVETHGTGTVLGDPIETTALGAVLGHTRPADSPLVLGSVKTNLGHLEGAAGIAGLIKAALCLRHRRIPPNLHYREPNPHIDFSGLGLRVPTALEPWPPQRKPLAGVSSFGWGGTNVHVVLEGRAEPEPIAWSSGPAALDPAGKAPPKVAFVCSPHGHQWMGMARSMLRHEPVFRAAMEQCDAELSRYVSWSLLHELFKPEGETSWDDVTVAQPALFAIELSLAAWWESRGVRPDAVVGHSLGELVAAVIAGVLDLPDAIRLVYHYTRVQGIVADRGGGMAIVELPAAKLERFADGERVVIAGRNGPRATVLSGEVTDLEAILSELRGEGVLCAMIRVGLAAHSPAIDEVMTELEESIAGITAHPARIPLYSTVTGELADWRELGPAYFAGNLRRPVVLADAMQAMLKAGYGVFVELSAHPVLLPALEQCAAESGHEAVVFATMRRAADDREGPAQTLADLCDLGVATEPPASGPQLFTLSAKTSAALVELAAKTAEHVEASAADLAGLCRTARGRSHHRQRLAIVAASRAELVEQLRSVRSAPDPIDIRQGVAFVFPGQGSQWIGMATELLRGEPLFHQAIRDCDAAAQPYLGWSILEELQADETASAMDRIEVIQPVLFAVQIGLARLWQSWGVTPAAVVGHSMGEVAASYTAGVITLDDAARIICRRSHLMARTSGQGAMLAVELTLPEAEEAISPYSDKVSIAVSNSARSTVLSGDQAALSTLAARLQGEEIFCRWVKVDVASHSPYMDVLQPELAVELQGIQSRAGSVPIYSTVTGEVEDGTGLDVGYWIDNLRRPVLFGQQVGRLMRSGVRVFLEMSPHPILLPAIEQVAMEMEAAVAVLPSLRRREGERQTLLASAGRLYQAGATVDLARINGPGPLGDKLAGYAWQHERFWFDESQSMADDRAAWSARVGLLGDRIDSAVEPGLHYWQMDLEPTSAAAYDHVIGGAVMLPGSAIVELALAAAHEVFPDRAYAVKDLVFLEPVLLPPGGLQTQVVLAEEENLNRLSVFKREGKELTRVAESALGPIDGTDVAPVDLSGISSRLPHTTEVGAFYADLAERGLEYGEAYRPIQSLAWSETEVLARLSLPEPVKAELPAYRIHPSLLDGAIQVGLAPALASTQHGFLSSGIKRVTVHRRPEDECWAHVVVREDAAMPTSFEIDVRLLSSSGEPLVEAIGVTILRSTQPLRFAERSSQMVGGVPGGSRSEMRIVGSDRDSLAALTDPGEQLTELKRMVAVSVAQVIKLPEQRVETDCPLRLLGLDSVMSLELRNRLEARFGMRLSATVIWNYPTVDELSTFLLQKMALSRQTPADPQPTADRRAEPLAEHVDGQTDEAMLARELAELTELVEGL